MPLFSLITIYLYVFLIGITIGSFLNVVIYRVPQKISIAKGRSFCPTCQKPLLNRDLIPIFSYLFLGGKCRSCKEKISLRYPLIELFCGLLAVFSAWFYHFYPFSIVFFAFCCVLLCMTMVDFDTMTIPDSFILSLVPIAIAWVFLNPNADFWGRVIGFFAISLPMYGSLYLIENAFGGADIKLFAIVGFILGWKLTLLCFFLSILIAGGSSIFLFIQKKGNIKGLHIPFGPSICISAVISTLFGNSIITWYLGFF